MARELTVSIGGHSVRGRKDANQDFHGALVPGQPALALKGIAVAIADGISSSAVGAVASETAVKSFLNDYYDTPQTWSVKTAAQRVVTATNGWLHAQTRRGRAPHDPDRGYVTTFSALVLKSRTAHVLHVGDARVCRVAGRALERLTEDHRVVISEEETYLGRALGVGPGVEIDYRAVPVEAGDVFVLTTDGVHEHVEPRGIAEAIAAEPDLDRAAARIVADALAAGSPDNLTIQIVRVEALPEAEPVDLLGQVGALAPAPLLDPGGLFEGYRIERAIHANSRSHVYLATDAETGERVVVKVPSLDLRGDADYLRRFMMEEWVARRIDSPHVVRAQPQARRRGHLYVVLRHFDGQSLLQWMHDHPAPDLETVRGIVEQIARGLQALHRRETVHRDLRPDNVLIDAAGTVLVIDLGAARVAGLAETEASAPEPVMGTVQYTAPESFLGAEATPGTDVFALGVIAYQMLTGRLPYGARAARARTAASQARLVYAPARDARPDLPAWVDGALRRAVHPDPGKRYAVASELVHDLRRPNPVHLGARRPSLLEHDPLLFWRGLSLVLGLAVLGLLAYVVARPVGPERTASRRPAPPLAGMRAPVHPAPPP